MASSRKLPLLSIFFRSNCRFSTQSFGHAEKPDLRVFELSVKPPAIATASVKVCLPHSNFPGCRLLHRDKVRFFKLC